MTRIERITKMEALFDKSEEVIKRLEAALEDFNELHDDIAQLEAYYDKDWRKDFEADEAGMLPKAKAIEDAIRGGVRRVHVISYKAPEGILAEVFTNEGTGTLVVADVHALTPSELTAAPQAPSA